MKSKTNGAGLRKQLDNISIAITVIALVLVALMRRVSFDVGIDFSFLPPFHATLNAMAAVALVFAYYYIRRKNIEMHRRSIYVAMGLSVLFLLSYVVYHFTTEPTLYCREGSIRYVYFFFLISHIITAAVVLPFILFTFNRGFTMAVKSHRRLARVTYPVWLYVAITGPICYFMLMPCY